MGMVVIVVVGVDERSFHLWKALDVRLEGLTDVMGLAEDHVLVKHNVHL